MNQSLLAQILDLSPAERIRLAQDIWDSVSDIPNADMLTDGQKQELKERLTALDNNPSAGIPWREVIAEIRGNK